MLNRPETSFAMRAEHLATLFPAPAMERPRRIANLDVPLKQARTGAGFPLGGVLVAPGSSGDAERISPAVHCGEVADLPDTSLSTTVKGLTCREK